MEQKIYPSMVIRSQAEAIELLENENRLLRVRISVREVKCEEYKRKIDKAINRISLLKMDSDTSDETIKAIDYILKALLD
ncbi:MAG: hypothetical protein IJV15_00090 [Lachnospiraceae bacterium]|nr:hypothetical protein [Lachnospiraceae bacterium]